MMNSEREISKEYTNGDITIIWKPKTCIHAAECVKLLPEVYKPDEKPWIQMENASQEDLIKQINECPSGALSYKLSNAELSEDNALGSKVEVMKNGPLLVYGSLAVTRLNGKTELKEKRTAFCRCGASNNKPYCDGEHRKVDFVG
jgi:uncharacterized Fe-S cluster protein YjdI